MKRVTGIGGIFFKSQDPKQLYDWYQKHLGIEPEPHGQGSTFHWLDPADPKTKGMTVWSIFPRDTTYFTPGQASFMINYRVENLDSLLAALRSEGVEIDPRREDYDYGRFAWILDPEGNRIELWEPPNMRVRAKSPGPKKSSARSSSTKKKPKPSARKQKRGSRSRKSSK